MFAIFGQIDSCVQKGSPEDLAILVRHYYLQEQGRNPGLSLDQLLRDCGFSIKTFPLGHLGALIVSDKQGNIFPSMMTDVLVRDFRRSFVLAYMFGYFLYEIQPKIITGKFKTSAYYQEFCPLGRYLAATEGEASQDKVATFAAALFLPKKMFEKALGKGLTMTKIAQIFQVPEDFARVRLAKLKLGVPIPEAEKPKPLSRLRQLANKIDNSVGR